MELIQFITIVQCVMQAFRKIESPEAMAKLVAFLKDDVRKDGGSAGEVINMHGRLWDITVSSSPWGLITIRKPVDKLESMSFWFGAAVHDDGTHVVMR